MHLNWLCILLLLAGAAQATRLPLPPRAGDAPTGSEFARMAERMPVTERELWVGREILRGNIPGFLRAFVPITFHQTLSNQSYTVEIEVLPDYLAVGSDTDSLLMPMTPLLGQRLADRLGCTLPTRKLVNVIWTNAAVKLNPSTIPPSAQMITMPVFVQHNATVRTQRDSRTNTFPRGALVSGHKKDVIISSRIYTNFASSAITAPVVIYGWHYTSGSPVQPLYNGHEQTYADYSHGVRLIRDEIRINGQSAFISQVLTNPALAPLLSDDSVAEGTSGGVIRLPRYTIAGFRPAVLQHPRSLRLLSAETNILNVVVGSEPEPMLNWWKNGLLLNNATNDTLTVSGSETEAGIYFLTVSNSFGAVTSRVAVVSLRTNGWPVVFSESFESETGSSWQVLWDSSDGIPDFQADFSFVHEFTPYPFNGAFSAVPPAPGSSSSETHALRLAVNGNDASGIEAVINVFPISLPVLPLNCIVSFDLWMNYPGGAGGVNSTGSTQHALFGFGHHGTNVNWPLSKTGTTGVWFGVSGEGGDSRDYRAYRGQSNGSLDLTGAQSAMTASNNTAFVYQQLFPASRFETTGSPGKEWVHVELHRTNGLLQWIMNGQRIATVANVSSEADTFVLGLCDVFKSIANPVQDAFVLFDNILVEDTSGAERVLSTRMKAGGELEFTFSAIPGVDYEIARSTDLTAWEAEQTLSTNRPPLRMIAPLQPGPVFYRVRRVLDAGL